MRRLLHILVVGLLLAGCATLPPPPASPYVDVPLKADLSALTAKQRRMLPVLIAAAREMDAVYWREIYGDPAPLFKRTTDPAARRKLEINYGPWDRLTEKPPLPGARFYPPDMTKAEFEAALAPDPALKNLFTLVRRDAAGKLTAIPYHQAFEGRHRSAANLLRKAAALAEEPGLKAYLEARAEALLTDDYRASDIAWMSMKENALDVVIGPIETYEDGLFGYKAAHEALVLVKDRAWSQKLQRYAARLPNWQRALPVPEKYRAETPGSDSDLGAYDAVFLAGQANAGPKYIALNLPNDEWVQLNKGTRRIQLKNVMRAKFDHIVVHLADLLIDPAQRDQVTFAAFFNNTMWHETAHGLGIKRVVGSDETIRERFREHHLALEEAKADAVGLFLIDRLIREGELPEARRLEHYVTSLASLFRSIRFGTGDAHGKSNLVRFNFLRERGAIVRANDGTYRVELAKTGPALGALSRRILMVQGDGNRNRAAHFLARYGMPGPTLKADLERLRRAGIPEDVHFRQPILE